MADRVHRKLAFLAADRVDHRPVRTDRDRDQRIGGAAIDPVPVDMGGLAQDHPQIAAAQLARQIGDQHVIGLAFGLLGNLLEEPHCGGPIAFARHFAHGKGQWTGAKRGALVGSGHGGRRSGEGRDRLAQPFQREHAVVLIRVLRGLAEIAFGPAAIPGLGRSTPGPIEPFGAGLRSARGGTIAPEQRRGAAAVVQRIERLPAAQPGQRSVVVADRKALQRHIGARREHVIDRGGDPNRVLGIGLARHGQQLAHPFARLARGRGKARARA